MLFKIQLGSIKDKTSSVMAYIYIYTWDLVNPIHNPRPRTAGVKMRMRERERKRRHEYLSREGETE